jgi:hypothetical protein
MGWRNRPIRPPTALSMLLMLWLGLRETKYCLTKSCKYFCNNIRGSWHKFINPCHRRIVMLLPAPSIPWDLRRDKSGSPTLLRLLDGLRGWVIGKISPVCRRSSHSWGRNLRSWNQPWPPWLSIDAPRPAHLIFRHRVRSADRLSHLPCWIRRHESIDLQPTLPQPSRGREPQLRTSKTLTSFPYITEGRYCRIAPNSAHTITSTEESGLNRCPNGFETVDPQSTKI